MQRFAAQRLQREASPPLPPTPVVMPVPPPTPPKFPGRMFVPCLLVFFPLRFFLRAHEVCACKICVYPRPFSYGQNVYLIHNHFDLIPLQGIA